DGVAIKSGETLAIAATGGGTATAFTFGATTSLAQLNTALAANNLTASLDSSNDLVITTTNDALSSTVGAITLGAAGTATFSAGTTPTADPGSQPFAPAWWASTTTSSRRSRQPRRIRPSTVSIC